MKNLITALVAIFLGLFIGGIILKISNISPIEAYQVMWEGAFSRPNFISYIIIRSTPLILTGLSVAFAFKTGLFNIGAEGQFIIGALVATVLGFSLDLHPLLQIPIVMILATLAAGLYGGISGYMKARFGVHEVLSTIMLNWIALYFSNYVVFLDFIRRPNMEATELIKPSASIGILENWKVSEAGAAWLSDHEFWRLFFRPPVNAGVIIALVVAFFIWFLIEKTAYGKKLKAVGFSPKASEYAGINTKAKMTQSMMISGALAGLAGVTHVMGVSKNISLLSAFEGYGFDGIATALIGAAHPFGVVLSGFFLGTLKYAGQKIQPELDAPGEIISIIIGLIVFFIAIPTLTKFLSLRRKK